MAVTPAQLADALVNFRLPPGPAMDDTQLDAMFDLMTQTSYLSVDDAISFWEESTAIYLRQVLDVYTQTDVSGGQGTALAAYQAHWLQHCLRTAAGARFARDFPLENRQLSLTILEQISHLPDFVFTINLAKTNLLPFTVLLVDTISDARFTGRQLPINISQSTSEGLQQRLPFVHRPIKDPPSWLNLAHEVTSLADLSYLVLFGGEITPILDNGTVNETTFLVWVSCELLRDGEDVEGIDEGTVRCDEGVEMDACSRCLAVRYCCKEHQKAHWKRHKPFCFKPEW